MSFSLVELVLVVLIVGIIAAIVIPRLGGASRSAVETALRGDLYTLRRAIAFYAADHGGINPAQDKKGETFAAQLTGRTNVDGEVGTTAGEHVFGPYLSAIPALNVGPNPGAHGIVAKNNGEVYENKSDVGWVYNYDIGELYANTDDLDSDGVAYNTY